MNDATTTSSSLHNEESFDATPLALITTSDDATATPSSLRKEEEISTPPGCCRRRCCCICWTVLISLVLVAVGAGVGFYFIFLKKGDLDEVGMCGDCHCIITDGSGTCPTPTPKIDFSDAMIARLASQVALNPYLLDCNPYYVPDDLTIVLEPCLTVPPQDESLIALGEEAACGIHYESYQDGVCSSEYKLQSYASFQEAEAAGAFVTHAGACGACSTTQDLAAYMKSPDLTTEGSFCAKQSILDFDRGQACYMNLGMTDSCANIWVYNSLNTAEKCLARCATTKNDPNNGPPPECTLNDCLQCDEDVSGPNFKQFAARTRRRSGLLSSMVRPCDALVNITQQECPETLPLIE
jgi:hypothetical protein